MDVFRVVEKLLVTERTSLMKEQGNKYVLRVSIKANKHEIKKAVEDIFKVDVLKVNTQNVRGKKRRMGRFEGVKPDWKKAVVTLKKGQEIKAPEEKA